MGMLKNRKRFLAIELDIYMPKRDTHMGADEDFVPEKEYPDISVTFREGIRGWISGYRCHEKPGHRDRQERPDAVFMDNLDAENYIEGNA